MAGPALVLLATGLLALLLAWFAGMRLVAAAASATGTGAPGRGTILLRLFAIFFVAAAAGLMVLSQAAGIVAAYGGATQFSLFATTGITGGIAVARLGGGWLIDRLSIPSVMAAAQAMAFAGTLLLTLWPGPEVCVAALLMIGMGYGVVSGATAAAVACYWPKAFYGRVVSRIYIAWCAAAVTLPVLAAHLFDVTGGYQTAILVAGAGNIVGVVTALTLPRQIRVEALPAEHVA